MYRINRGPDPQRVIIATIWKAQHSTSSYTLLHYKYTGTRNRYRHRSTCGSILLGLWVSPGMSRLYRGPKTLNIKGWEKCGFDGLEERQRAPQNNATTTTRCRYTVPGIFESTHARHSHAQPPWHTFSIVHTRQNRFHSATQTRNSSFAPARVHQLSYVPEIHNFGPIYILTTALELVISSDQTLSMVPLPPLSTL